MADCGEQERRAGLAPAPGPMQMQWVKYEVPSSTRDAGLHKDLDYPGILRSEGGLNRPALANRALGSSSGSFAAP